MPADPDKRPVRWSPDLLRNVWTPRLIPSPVPTPSVFDEPLYCLHVNGSWLTHVLGALDVLSAPDTWTGTAADVERALQEVEKLVNLLKEPCENASMSFKLRQNAANPCRLEQSLDGGQTWTLAFDYSSCMKPTPVVLDNTNGPVTPSTVFNILRSALKNQPNANPYIFLPSSMKAVGLEIERGDCAAAGYMAEVFQNFWNEAAKAEYEGTLTNADSFVTAALSGIFSGALLLAGAGAKGTVLGIPAGLALDALALAAPLAADFYANIAVGAFRSIYEALGGGAEPPIHPLLINEIKCTLIDQLKAARTYSSFASVSGPLIPPAVADAWSMFASLEMWAVFNTFSTTVDKDQSFCCGENCYPVPPAAMVITDLSNPQNGVSWKSAAVTGQYLRSSNPGSIPTTGINESIRARTFYPFDEENGNVCTSVRLVVDASVGSGAGGASVMVHGYKMDGSTTNNIPGYPWEVNTHATLNGLNEYVFTRTALNRDPWKGLFIRVDATGITNSSTVFSNAYAILRAVEVCIED